MTCDRLFPFGRSKEHRPHPTLVRDATIASNQIEPLRHRCIRGGHCIIHLVDEGGEFESHLQHAGLADFDAFVEGLVLTNEYAIHLVLIDLPAVGRVNFLDVNCEEIDAVTIGAVDPIEGPSLGPKGRSGVASEDQRHRTICEMIRKSDPLVGRLALAGQEGQLEVRRRLTDTGF